MIYGAIATFKEGRRKIVVMSQAKGKDSECKITEFRACDKFRKEAQALTKFVSNEELRIFTTAQKGRIKISKNLNDKQKKEAVAELESDAGQKKIKHYLFDQKIEKQVQDYARGKLDKYEKIMKDALNAIAKDFGIPIN